MRELAIKRSQPSIVPRNDEIGEPAEEKPISLKRLFHGWLREVPAREAELHPDHDHDVGIRRVFPSARPAEIARQASRRNLEKGELVKEKWKVLSTRELLGINRATVRESETHRYWPSEVILKFMVADVVTRKQDRR